MLSMFFFKKQISWTLCNFFFSIIDGYDIIELSPSHYLSLTTNTTTQFFSRQCIPFFFFFDPRLGYITLLITIIGNSLAFFGALPNYMYVLNSLGSLAETKGRGRSLVIVSSF